jgi:hypothetical protein
MVAAIGLWTKSRKVVLCESIIASDDVQAHGVNHAGSEMVRRKEHNNVYDVANLLSEWWPPSVCGHSQKNVMLCDSIMDSNEVQAHGVNHAGSEMVRRKEHNNVHAVANLLSEWRPARFCGQTVDATYSINSTRNFVDTPQGGVTSARDGASTRSATASAYVPKGDVDDPPGHAQYITCTRRHYT